MRKKTIFYSGNGNHALSTKVLRHLNEYRGEKNVHSHTNFSEHVDGELNTKYPTFSEIKGQNVVLQQTITDRELLEESFEMGWAIKRQYEADHLIMVIPFSLYRRQEHEENLNEVCRLKMIIDRFKHVGVDEIITVSPHSPSMEKFCNQFGIKFWEVDPSPLYASTINTYLPETPSIYAPDKGSIIRAIKLAKLIGARVIFNLKVRGTNTEANIKVAEEHEIKEVIAYFKEKYNFSELYYVNADLIKGENIVIIEDEISTGETANKTGKWLKRLEANELLFLAMHPVCARSWREKFFDGLPYTKVMMGNTIAREYKKQTGGLVHDIDVSELIAQTLYKCLQENGY